MKDMQIGNVNITGNVFLAPMAGVTDYAFRQLAIEYGCSATETEMVSAKALMYRNPKTIALLKVADNEKIKIVQLFGHEPEVFASVLRSHMLDNFDIIDINMGCPAPKIVNNGDGSALMKNIELASQIIKACAENTDKPIMVKMRLGYDDTHKNYVEFAKMCERAGASAITVHGRTRTQMYSGHADLDAIKEVVDSVNIPVIGNGDVIDKESYENMINYTDCDGVMIGRGALGNLQIFSEIAGKKVPMETKDCVLKHLQLLRSTYGDIFAIKHMRKHILWYMRGKYNNREMKTEVVQIDQIDTLIDKINIIFK